MLFPHSLGLDPGEEPGEAPTDHRPKEWVLLYWLLEHKAEGFLRSQ